MLYSYLLDPLASSQDLPEVVLRRQGRKLSNSRGRVGRRHAPAWPGSLLPEIAREELKRLYEEIELPLSDVLADVEAIRHPPGRGCSGAACRANSITSSPA